jgi:hypothetical protein
MALRRRTLAVGTLLLGALSIAGAQDDGKPAQPLESLSDAPGSTPEPPRSHARRHGPSERPGAIDEPFEALRAPLDDAEHEELVGLCDDLGAAAIDAREEAARAIRKRFGARAAGPLLDVAARELDCERRFRERALSTALVFDWFLEHAPHCGWLGVRWQGSSTERHYFAAHVVEAVSNEPAARGGVHTNDDIVKWNGETMESQLDFIDHVQAQAPGTVADLTVERNGREVTVHVTMGTRVDPSTHLPEMPYPTFQRDMATRSMARWLEEWRRKN